MTSEFSLSDNSAILHASSFILEYDSLLFDAKRELDHAKEGITNVQLTADSVDNEVAVENVCRAYEKVAKLKYNKELCEIRLDANALLKDLDRASQGDASRRSTAAIKRTARKAEEARKAARKTAREEREAELDNPTEARSRRELAETVDREKQASQCDWPYEERFFDEISAFDGVFHMVNALRMKLFGGAW